MNKLNIKTKELDLRKHLNVNDSVVVKKDNSLNSIGVIYNDYSKLQPAVTKTWRDNVYSFNKNFIKHIPTQNTEASDLLKYYFNMYNRQLEKKTFKGRKRHVTRFRRLSVNRILISKLESSFTSNNVLLNLFVFNPEKYFLLKHLYTAKPKLKKRLKYYKKKDIRLSAIKRRLFLTTKLAAFKLEIRKLFLNEQKTIFNNKLKTLIKAQSKEYIRPYLYAVLQKHIKDIVYKYLLFINQSKFNEIFTSKLIPFLEKIYKKKVNLNLINLKYFHMNNELTSKIVTMRLRKREISRYRLLKKLKRYLNKQFLSFKNKTNKINKIKNVVITNSRKNLILLRPNNTNISLNKNYFSHLLMDIFSTKKKGFFKNVNYKFVGGVMMKISGRLTKRFTAARSIKETFNKGGIKNVYSRHKIMSSTLTKGYLMPSVQYTKMNYKTRVGAYGIKGWLGSV